MAAMASEITSLTVVYSTVYWGTNRRTHQSPAWLALFPAQMASKTTNVSIWWRHHRKSTRAQAMACCLQALSHHMIQWKFITNKDTCHSPDCNFTSNVQDKSLNINSLRVQSHLIPEWRYENSSCIYHQFRIYTSICVMVLGQHQTLCWLTCLPNIAQEIIVNIFCRSTDCVLTTTHCSISQFLQFLTDIQEAPPQNQRPCHENLFIRLWIIYCFNLTHRTYLKCIHNKIMFLSRHLYCRCTSKCKHIYLSGHR